MKLFDLTAAAAAENLAWDEALLNSAEAGHGGEVLRFWEPQEYFVVVGYANKVKAEVNLAACAANHVPIFRRCSGGGTVLQGPGCLNYTLVLKIAGHPALANISVTNRFIMERHRAAIESEIISRKSENSVAVQGHTDLTLVTPHSSLVTARKFSGNSQRRLKHFLLFHGTFLLDVDLSTVAGLLEMPSRQPNYRNHRSHTEFLTNLHVPAERLKGELSRAWHAIVASPEIPPAEIERLVAERYATMQWNFKF